MTSTTRSGMVQTVSGLIDPADVGVAMMHEHVFLDERRSFREPESPHDRVLAHQPISLDNLWWVRHNVEHSLDALWATDVDEAIIEAQRLVDAGGRTLVDVSPRWAGDLPPAEDLVRVANEAGLNIVKGTGYYIDGSYPDSCDVPGRTADEIAQDMVSDVIEGVGDSRVRSGIIGEIGCSWPLTDNERKVLRAAALAQIETGVAITVHPSRNEAALAQIRDILAEAGADLTRVILGHIDRCGYSLETRRELLDSGCVLEYDFFGWEGHYRISLALKDGAMPNLPNDLGRIKELQELISLGYGDQLLMSQDVSSKIHRTLHGGWGYGHILRNVVPLMTLYGSTQSEIDRILVGTPRRLLTIS